MAQFVLSQLLSGCTLDLFTTSSHIWLFIIILVHHINIYYNAIKTFQYLLIRYFADQLPDFYISWSNTCKKRRQEN